MRFALVREAECESDKRRCGMRVPSQRDGRASGRLFETEPYNAVKGREADTPIAGVIQC